MNKMENGKWKIENSRHTRGARAIFFFHFPFSIFQSPEAAA